MTVLTKRGKIKSKYYIKEKKKIISKYLFSFEKHVRGDVLALSEAILI